MEFVKGNLMCLPRGHEWQNWECNLLGLLHSINLFLLRKDKTWSPGCPRRLCQVDDDKAANVDRCLALFVILWLVIIYRSPWLSHLMIGIPVWKYFTEKPNGSNSIETLLSVVNWRTDTKFLIKFGASRTLFRIRGGWGVSKCVLPRPIIGTKWPFPTMILLFLFNLK